MSTETEIKAGPETDLRVAKACGLDGAFNDGDEVFYFRQAEGYPVGNEEAVSFRPSVDWNDAMFAAGLFGLFDNCRLNRWFPSWVVSTEEDKMIGRDPSGPLAICKAIIALGEAK
jgi:hypothetical protein